MQKRAISVLLTRVPVPSSSCSQVDADEPATSGGHLVTRDEPNLRDELSSVGGAEAQGKP